MSMALPAYLQALYRTGTGFAQSIGEATMRSAPARKPTDFPGAGEGREAAPPGRRPWAGRARPGRDGGPLAATGSGRRRSGQRAWVRPAHLRIVGGRDHGSGALGAAGLDRTPRRKSRGWLEHLARGLLVAAEWALLIADVITRVTLGC